MEVALIVQCTRCLKISSRVVVYIQFTGFSILISHEDPNVLFTSAAARLHLALTRFRESTVLKLFRIKLISPHRLRDFNGLLSPFLQFVLSVICCY